MLAVPVIGWAARSRMLLIFLILLKVLNYKYIYPIPGTWDRGSTLYSGSPMPATGAESGSEQ